MASSEKYDVQAFVAACKGSHGIRINVARAVGCSYPTFLKYLKKYLDISEALAEAKAIYLGDAENTLVRGVYGADLALAVATAKFVLTRQSDEWQERQAIDLTFQPPARTFTDKEIAEAQALASVLIDNMSSDDNSDNDSFSLEASSES